MPETANLPSTPKTLEGLLNAQNVRKRFDDILGKKAAGFISSIISAAVQNPDLGRAEPMTVIAAAAVAASLDLPINPNLGFAHIVPYSGRAQFQMGWRGYVQLGQRTGQYRTINVAIVHEGELEVHNKFTGEMKFNADSKTSDKIIGYVAYFRLLNGFEKYFYMTKEEVEAHGKRYSKSYEKKESRWQRDFDAMALKTVIKLLLNRWGILSIEMQTALHADQAVIKDVDSADYEYVDSTEEEKPPIDTSAFDKLIEPLDVDRAILDTYLEKIAKFNKKSVEEIKVECVPVFDEFWGKFTKWAGKQKQPNIKCPDGNPEASKDYCDKTCTKRQGCPVW
jgi:recombination protein RecT